jgi:hypothetical protein
MLGVIWITLLLVFLFSLGSAVGSFLNVCIVRLPEGRSLIHPGSCCSHCHKPIRMEDNLPLVSYWVLRGRCRACGAPFSMRYFWVELLLVSALGRLSAACVAAVYLPRRAGLLPDRHRGDQPGAPPRPPVGDTGRRPGRPGVCRALSMAVARPAGAGGHLAGRAAGTPVVASPPLSLVPADGGHAGR